jgi:hypothetical protein
MSKNFWIALFIIIIITTLFLSNKNDTDNKSVLIIGIVIIALFVLSIACNRIREKYLEDDPMLVELKNTLQECFPEINNTILLKGKKSYTINKKRIHLCLKDENGQYYDKNMLLYVTIHELAHVLCDEVGHTDKFYQIFDTLLDRAHNHGIYDKHKPLIRDYCEYSKE